jgi:drug/metabolite transporter (DMT)-like permease
MSKWSARTVLLGGVILSALLNATGQLFFKAARSTHSDATLFSLFSYPEVWGGLVVYGLSSVCWLWVLARAPLSFAYPILSLTFPIVVGVLAIFFAELILPLRWMGVGMIVLGVSFLART